MRSDLKEAPCEEAAHGCNASVSDPTSRLQERGGRGLAEGGGWRAGGGECGRAFVLSDGSSSTTFSNLEMATCSAHYSTEEDPFSNSIYQNTVWVREV